MERGKEIVDMPVLFFVDPKILDDPRLSDVEDITLSYIFYPVVEEAGEVEDDDLNDPFWQSFNDDEDDDHLFDDDENDNNNNSNNNNNNNQTQQTQKQVNFMTDQGIHDILAEKNRDL